MHIQDAGSVQIDYEADPKVTIELEYWNMGPNASSFGEAIVLKVQGKPDFTLQLKDTETHVRRTFEVTRADPESRAVDIEFKVAVCDLSDIIGVKSRARVVVKSGTAVLFEEDYKTRMHFRSTTERLTVRVP